MSTLHFALRSLSVPVAGLALASAAPAFAQAEVVMTEGEIQSLPADLQTAPAPTPETSIAPAQTGGRTLGETEEVIIGEDGVETVIRTRYITPRTATRSIPPADSGFGQPAPVQYYPVSQPVVFEREQWLSECRRRTDGRDGKEKGGIIGGLLGAITGGIIGNRVSSGERLAGTLIGAGTGGLAGLAIGTLIGDGDDDDRYDCEAALNDYLQNNTGLVAAPPQRFARRTIAAPAYGYGGCNCYQAQPVQQTVLVPVQTTQRQRVIVRETVREEFVPEPVRERTIPEPRMIKQPTRVLPAPRPIKMIKN